MYTSGEAPARIIPGSEIGIRFALRDVLSGALDERYAMYPLDHVTDVACPDHSFGSAVLAYPVGLSAIDVKVAFSSSYDPNGVVQEAHRLVEECRPDALFVPLGSIFNAMIKGGYRSFGGVLSLVSSQDQSVSHFLAVPQIYQFGVLDKFDMDHPANEGLAKLERQYAAVAIAANLFNYFVEETYNL